MLPELQPSSPTQAVVMQQTSGIGMAVVGGSAGEGGFSSSDPLVDDLANEIEAAYPDHVKGVNMAVTRPDGTTATDGDIVTGNAIIQVKSGGGKGLSTQVENTENATGMVTIGYGPDLKGSVVKGMQSKGQLVTKDKQTLIDVVRPDKQ